MGRSLVFPAFVLAVSVFVLAGTNWVYGKEILGQKREEVEVQVLDIEAALKARPQARQEEAHRENEWEERKADVGGEDAEEAMEEEEEAMEESSSFVVKIVHRDSIGKSSNGSMSVSSRVRERLKRDSARVKSINDHVGAAMNESKVVGGKGGDFSSSIISGLSLGSGEYFTRVGVGSPARYSYMVLDTGSDIVWLQCMPCARCYQQKDPIFNPSASTTYRKVACAAPVCKRLDSSGCSSNRRYCEYQVSYGDGSFTVGDLARETMTFRGAKVGNVALGCGHDNEGLFVGAAGLLGLGRGGLSFPSQTASRFANKFSYCLVDRDNTGSSSFLMFGPSALPRSALYTPLLSNPKFNTFYYVQLSGISVGGRRLSSIPASVFRPDGSGNGGVIIDSGTSVTRLVQSAYESMRDAFRAGTKRLKSAAGFSLFDTCYDLSGLTTVKVPTLVFHFDKGAHLSLPANNYLIPVDNSGVFCFAFAGTTGGLSIIGNIQQQGFRVAFDMQSNRLGFAAGSCS